MNYFKKRKKFVLLTPSFGTAVNIVAKDFYFK